MSITDIFSDITLQNTILTLIGGGIGGIFTRYFDIFLYKKKQRRKINKKVLRELYLPMIKQLNKFRIINGECRNLNVGEIQSVIIFIENNYEYASEDLIKNYWQIIDKFEVVQSGDEIIDVGYLVDCINREYTALKKEVIGF